LSTVAYLTPSSSKFSRTQESARRWFFEVGNPEVWSEDSAVQSPSPGGPDLPLPELIDSEAALDEVQTRPSSALRAFVQTVRGPLLILGAGGKMGPSLAVLAKRAGEEAGHKLEVIAASRFGDGQGPAWLEERGVRTHRVDLLDPESVQALPDAPDILYLVGLKFGTAQNPALTWAVNTQVPAHVCRRFPQSRIVALSTGNVYPLSVVGRGGADEADSLTPLGEYANAAVARERVFQFYSDRLGVPIVLLRLYYAVELRYGVLVDIARKVHASEPIDLENGHVTCIWQADANEMIIRALALARTPAAVFNLCRPEVFSVRDVAERLGKFLGYEPRFIGQESDKAIVGNAAKLCAALGTPRVELDTMLKWIAHWVKGGGRNLDRPTHFETRDGRY
jgi:nucleoside-diphosphate-sugar epimerase